MKKLQTLAVLALLVFCAISYSHAQITVIGTDSAIEPAPVEKDEPIRSEEIEISEECWNPEAYFAELRILTLDQYADRIAENLLTMLESSGSKLLDSVEEYELPTVDDIKANFYAQAASFEIEGAGPDTVLGEFCDQIAQTLAAKIASLNGAERRLLGIYFNESNEDMVKNLSQNVIWTLESMTVQKFYDEFYSILHQYIRDPFINNGDEPLNADGSLIRDDK